MSGGGIAASAQASAALSNGRAPDWAYRIGLIGPPNPPPHWAKNTDARSAANFGKETIKQAGGTLSGPAIQGQNPSARSLVPSSLPGLIGQEQEPGAILPHDLAAIADQHRLSGGMHAWDTALDFMESPLVQSYDWIKDSIKLGSASLGAARGAMGAPGGIRAMLQNAGVRSVGKAMAGGFLAGIVGSVIGSLAGNAAGHWIMGDVLGRPRLAGDGNEPATVGMPIAHSSQMATLGAMVAGAGVACGIGIALMIWNPVGWLAFALVAAAAAAYAAGQAFAGAASQYGENMGEIIEGSPNVFFEGRAVACVGHKVRCDRHGMGHHLAEGSETVLANGRPITRIGHITTCNATVNDGIKSIGIDMTTSATRLPVEPDTADMIARTLIVGFDVAPTVVDRARSGPKPNAAAPAAAPNAPTAPASKPSKPDTPQAPTSQSGPTRPPAASGTPSAPAPASTRPASSAPAANSPPPATRPALPAGQPPRPALPPAPQRPALPPGRLPNPAQRALPPAPQRLALPPGPSAKPAPPALPPAPQRPALPPGRLPNPAQRALPPAPKSPDPTPIQPPAGNNAVGSGGNKPRSATTTVGDPINVVTGQFVDERVELMIPGTIPLRLTRCHAPDSTGVQGKGWAGSWAQQLRIDGETVIYQNAEGTLITFHAPQGEIFSHNLQFPHLEMMGQRDGAIHIFDYDTRLFHSFSHRRGAYLLLGAIGDMNGNRITFSYDPEGLTRVSHSDGFALAVRSRGMLMREAALEGDSDLRLRWDYNGAGQLTLADSGQTGRIAYRYDDAGRLVGWSDPATAVHYAYDKRNRIVRSWSDSGHFLTLLDYDEAARQTTVHVPGQGSEVFGYDAQGLVTSRVDRLGGVWHTSWNRFQQRLDETDPLGQSTQWRYDGNGKLISVTDPDGHVTRYGYDRERQLATITDANGQTRRLTRNDAGDVIRIDEADGSFLRLRRGTKGEIVRIERPGGAQERIYYDALMRPRVFRSPSGQERRTSYDIEGRLLWQVDELGAETRFDLTRGDDNPLGDVRAARLPDGTGWQMRYDASGRPATMIDATGATRHWEYGPFGFLYRLVDPLGHALRFDYDIEGRLAVMTNPLGQRYEMSYDAAGRVVAERDFAGQITRYHRDAVGRTEQRITPDGATLMLAWSAGGHVVGSSAAGPDGAADNHRFAYDPVGRLIRAENDLGVVEYSYDALGRVVSERADGREIRIERDSAGRPIARQGDVLGLAAEWRNDGRLSALAIGGHDPLRFDYDLRGQESRRVSAAGFALIQSHDIGGLLSEQIAGAWDSLSPEARLGTLGSRAYHHGLAQARRSYGRDAVGRVAQIRDGMRGATALDLDERGQVRAMRHQARDGKSHETRYAYDAAGDLAGASRDARPEPVTMQAGRIRQRGRISWRHDACGRVIEKIVEEPGFRPRVWRMDWDARGQLCRLAQPDGTVWRYGYDALGRRVRAIRSSDGKLAGRAYQWEGERIIAEAPVDERGVAQWGQAANWVYGPDDYTPLAREQNGRLAYVVPDHLGTPREILTEDGARTVWRARPGLWGDLEEAPANDDFCPIRFPGQWHDPESRLHYNRFRYYDADATQYLSTDPLGLSGGPRPQGYVANPFDWIDPLGLTGTDPRTHVTYRGIDAQTGKPYVGYASKPGDGHSMQQVLNYRYGSGYDRFQNGMMPEEVYTGNDKATARGLEQRVFEAEGGLDGTANRQNPVGANNKNRATYLDAADNHLKSHPYTPLNAAKPCG